MVYHFLSVCLALQLAACSFVPAARPALVPAPIHVCRSAPLWASEEPSNQNKPDTGGRAVVQTILDAFFVVQTIFWNALECSHFNSLMGPGAPNLIKARSHHVHRAP